MSKIKLISQWALGKLNFEGHWLVELCARIAAAIADNSDITPEGGAVSTGKSL